MKKTFLIIIAGLLLISLNVFADDVSIDSNGKTTTGVTNPNGHFEVIGPSGKSSIVGSANGTGASGVYGINTTNGNYGILGYETFGVYGNSSSGWAGYFQGNVHITGNLTVDGTFNVTETDPQVGTLLDGMWCNSDGTQVNCNQSPPVLTETDPTVPASIKDGIDWTEVTNRPAGLDDGDDVGITVETDPKVGSNLTNYVPKWDGTALVSGSIIDNGGKVSVGTTLSEYMLEVGEYANPGIVRIGPYLRLDGGNRTISGEGGLIFENINEGYNLTLRSVTDSASYGDAVKIQTENAFENYVDRVTITGKVDTAKFSILDSDVGIGTTNPTGALEVARDQTTPHIRVTGYKTDSGSPPMFVGMKARGTMASPSAVQAGDMLVGFSGFGYGSDHWSTSSRGRLNINAAENWTNTAQGTYIGINTTQIGTTNSMEKMRITDAGDVGIGTATPGQKLTVAGTIESTSGGIKFPDGTTQATASTGGGGDITAVNAGTGLSGGGPSGDVTLTADITYLQRRVTGNCSGQVMAGINADGTVNCETDDGITSENDPTVNALGKATLSCSSGQVAKWNGAIWTCANDIDTNTTYSAGTGLDLTGTAFSVEIPLVLNGSLAYGGIFSGTNSAAYGRGVYGSATSNEGGYNYGGYFESAGYVGRGVYGEATYSGNYTNFGGFFTANGWTGNGVFGWAQYSGAATNIGGSFQANGTTGRGVQGHAANAGSVTNYGGYFTAAGSTGIGVYGMATKTGAVLNYGGYFEAAGDSGMGAYGSAIGTSGTGIWGNASGSSGTGVRGEATYTGTSVNYGGQFFANGTNGIGVHGSVSGTDGYGGSFEAYGTNGRGVYGYSSGANSRGVVGYGAVAGTSYDFYAEGPGQNYGAASSVRWKRNIVDINNALDKILNLRGVYFDWDEEHGGQHDMGFIAEEVGKIIPEVVAYEPDGVYATGVDYGAITPMLVQAIKEQQKLINRQQKQIDELKAMMEELRKRL